MFGIKDQDESRYTYVQLYVSVSRKKIIFNKCNFLDHPYELYAGTYNLVSNLNGEERKLSSYDRGLLL